MDVTTNDPAPVQRGRRRERRPWVTYGIIAANVAVFAWMLAKGVDVMGPSPQEMLELGGTYPARTLDGEGWRLLTSMFLHYGVVHLGLNMLGLWQGGTLVELIFGKVAYAAMYLVSGLAGGVATLVAGGDGVAAGASGAVFGMFGAFGAFLLLRRATMPAAVWQQAARQMAIFLGINLVYGLSVPGISMAAHIGGLLAGAGFAAAVIAGTGTHGQRLVRVAVLTVVGLGGTAAVVAAMDAPPDLERILNEVSATDEEVVDRYKELTIRHEAGELDEAALAEAIERDVIAPWTALRARLDAVGDVPPAGAKALGNLRRYVEARHAAWEALVAFLRAPPADRARLQTALEEKVRAVEAAMRPAN